MKKRLKISTILAIQICACVSLSFSSCSQSTSNESLLLGTWHRIDRTRVDSDESQGALFDSILTKIDSVFETDTKKTVSSRRIEYIFEKDNVFKRSRSVQEPHKTGNYYMKNDSLKLFKTRFKVMQLTDSLLVYREPTVLGSYWVCTFKKVSE